MFWLKQYKDCVSHMLFVLLLLQSQNANAYIVPDELVSLLSLVWSNIPPIKKGTDSRVGFGYRLGHHADFQVVFELGPQKRTRPLGDQNNEDQSFNKRQASANQLRELLRKQQKKQQEEQLMTSTERIAASWLESWSDGMKPQKHKGKVKSKLSQTVTESGSLGLPTPPKVPQDAMQQLQQLLKMATSTTTTSSTSSTTTTTPEPFTGGALNLGGPSGFKLPPPSLIQDTNNLSNGLPSKSQTEITKELMDVSLEQA